MPHVHVFSVSSADSYHIKTVYYCIALYHIVSCYIKPHYILSVCFHMASLFYSPFHACTHVHAHIVVHTGCYCNIRYYACVHNMHLYQYTDIKIYIHIHIHTLCTYSTYAFRNSKFFASIYSCVSHGRETFLLPCRQPCLNSSRTLCFAEVITHALLKCMRTHERTV